MIKLPSIKESEILDEIRDHLRLGNIYQDGVWIRIHELKDNWGSITYHFGANPPCHPAHVGTPEMLATVLFDLSMECQIYKFETIRGKVDDISIAGYGNAVVGYDIYLVHSKDHQTNITGELVETFVELVEDSLECAKAKEVAE